METDHTDLWIQACGMASISETFIIGEKGDAPIFPEQERYGLKEQQICLSHMGPFPRRCTDGVNQQGELIIRCNDLAGFVSSITGFYFSPISLPVLALV